MSMSVMIADKSIPFAVSLAGALRSRDVCVALVSDASVEEVAPVSPDSAGLAEVPWNRPSTLSARTVPLAAKNRFGSLDQAILVFDTPLLEAAFPPDDSLSPVRVADEYIRGYMLLVRELGLLFAAQGKGRFVFALRARDAAAERSSPSAANLPISVAEAAFIRLAEETALSCGGSKDSAVQSLLVRMENQDDAGNLPWLTEQLMAPAGNRSQGGRWLKAGTRGLFGKF